MDKILSLITDLEIEAEKLEPSRKELVLDLIDQFEVSLKEILRPEDDMDDDSADQSEPQERPEITEAGESN